MKRPKKHTNISDLLFLTCFLFLIYSGLFFAILSHYDYNMNENRMAYKLKDYINYKTITSQENKDNIETALADQFPKNSIIKNTYYNLNNYITIGTTKFIVKNNNDSYIWLADKIKVFGGNDNIVYDPYYINNNLSGFDNRIKNINDTIKITKIPLYLYYIEKDTDIDFSENQKTGIYDYLKMNINSNNFYCFEINNFNDFNNYFYETDHHWNYKGSYKAYSELANILGIENKIKAGKTSCAKGSFTGSKVSMAGATKLFKDELCAYQFDFPKHKTFINGEETQSYGINNISKLTYVSYLEYYGYDYAEVIIDYNNPENENILIIGESFDNALINLLAPNYNKLFSIDLRHYERTFGKKFDYLKYIKENKIDTVLLIGNIGFYEYSDFNLEVD